MTPGTPSPTRTVSRASARSASRTACAIARCVAGVGARDGEEAEAGVRERVDAAQAHPGRVALGERVAARLVLRPARLDDDAFLAENRRRVDHAHPLELRDAQPQPLDRPEEGVLLDDGLPEQRPLERVGRVLDGDVLGTEEHLDAAGVLALSSFRLQRKQAGADAHSVGLVDADDQVRRAEEARDELGPRPRVQLVRRPDLEQPAFVEHADPVGDLERLFLVVRDEDRRDSHLALDAVDGAPQIDADLRVERAERLVEQQHLGAMRQRAGERDALLLAAGELAGHARTQARKIDELEQLFAAAATLVLGDASDLEGELDVLGDVHVAKQRVVLEDDADRPLLWRERRDVAAVKDDAAVIARRQPGDHPEDRALAAAAGTQKDQQLAVRDLERDLVHDRVAIDPLRDLVEDDRHAA